MSGRLSKRVAEDKATLWGFIRRYAPDATPERLVRQELARLALHDPLMTIGNELSPDGKYFFFMSARPRLGEDLADVTLEKQAEVAEHFDAVHSVERAREVGSLSKILPPERMRATLIADLRAAGFGATVLNGEGVEGEVRLTLSAIPRRQLHSAIEIVREVNPQAYVTVDDVAANPAHLMKAARARK